MKKLLLAVLLLTGVAFAQGSFYSLPQSYPNALVRVCPVPAIGNPCISPSSMFSDSALTQPLANPFLVSSTGSFGFWIAAGQYTIQIAAPYSLTYVISLGGGGSFTGGTITSPILAADGTAGAPSFAFSGATGTGFSRNATDIVFSIAGTPVGTMNNTNNGGFKLRNDVCYAWAGTTTPTGADTTTLCLSSNGNAVFGSGTANDGTTKLKAAGFLSGGTKFTQDTGCGTIVTSSGGVTVGQFTTVGSTSCTTVVTFGNTATSAHNWACFAHDLTTSADYNNPHISSNTTTATIVTGTIVSGDVIEFGCLGY